MGVRGAAIRILNGGTWGCALISAGVFIWTSMRPSLTLIMALLTLNGVALLAFVLTDILALIFGSMAAMGLIGGVYMIVRRSFLQ